MRLTGLLRVLTLAGLLVSCSGQDTVLKDADLPDATEQDVGQQEEVAITPPDLQSVDQPDLARIPDGTSDLAEVNFGCQPGEGCFLDECQGNDDCLSGWCVDYLGEGVCSQACQEECPQGWSCKLLGSTGPDPVYVCLADHANLCKPCQSNADCHSQGDQEDVCVSYQDGTGFCGGKCSDDEDCPWGFACQETTTLDGIATTQCVAEAGVCPCTAKSVELSLWTPCLVANDWGQCAGKRICTEDGLSTCDAPTPTEEICNGLDDDCDGDVDEPDEVGGDYINLCDDHNQCTVDSCDGEAGCVNQVLDSGECKDGDACTVGDHCEAGECVGNPVLCDDQNPCTDDSCDGTGGCLFEQNTAACDDGNPCTVADQCAAGSCVGVPVPCDCQADADCDEHEDGDVCNGTLFCDLSQWPYQCRVDEATVVECPAPEGLDAPCLAPVCNPDHGSCDFAPVNNGAACDDDDSCSVGEYCEDGLCSSGVAANCADDNPCTDDSCDPAAGCLHIANDAPCQDASACTVGDHCVGGICVAGDLLACDDGNECTDDSCDEDVGCVHQANAAACNDGNACSVGDHCAGGACVYDAWLLCDDGDVCTTDSCDPEGGCAYQLNDAPCDDGNLCTTGDHCHLGECTSSGSLTCNDDNPCTDDACVPQTGCLFTANADPCDDGSACTLGDHCQNAWCVSGPSMVCDDSNPCTDDLCNPDSGCQFEANAAVCDDNDLCTVGDVCSGGECTSGQEALDCDDDNVCTDDACDSLTGCGHVANESECDGGTCQDGECVSVCEPIVYGTAGIGVNNGWTCVDVCSSLGGSTVNWGGAQEQIDYCTSLHPGASHFIKDPNNFSYPIYEPQNNNCKVNADGNQSQGFAGNGTPDYGDQILCRCQVDCPCLPDCENKVCGDDGCGGSCGECGPGKGCEDFVCVDCPSGSKDFAYTGGIETFVLPDCVTTLTIDVAGAEGGRNTDDNFLGGRGARMSGTVTVPSGSTLNLIVGGKGEDVKANAGGGGGSYVWLAGGETLLMAAGGGGGGGYDNAGIDAVTAINGTNGNGVTGGAGVDGNGGTAPDGYNYLGGGGAGWKSNGSLGKTSASCSPPAIARRPLEGGAGGTFGGDHAYNGNGGFGGGGAGQGGCVASGGAGGGGGYSGGGPGGYLSPDIRGGGGGGSFNGGIDQNNASGVQTGHGYVKLTW